MNVSVAVQALTDGLLVGMPTETVYGLAGNALNEHALAAIFSAKQRPHFDPLIVHVASIEQAESCGEVTDRVRLLMEHFWPGPLTFVVQRRSCIPDLVTSGMETVALRCPDHPVALALIQESGLPLAAPSANTFGRISPTTAAHVHEQLGDAVACVVDGGPCRVGVESTVLACYGKEFSILRSGAVTAEQIIDVCGEQVRIGNHDAHLPPEAPGMLDSHYAPRMPLRLRNGAWPCDVHCGLLSFDGVDIPERYHGSEQPIEILSATGNLQEAAAHLFAALRRLEACEVTNIVADLVPNNGIGIAINDRIQKAAGPRLP